MNNSAKKKRGIHRTSAERIELPLEVPKTSVLPIKLNRNKGCLINLN